MIFKRSLRDGLFPQDWKSARIMPLHKKGYRTNIVNYRSIVMLFGFPKLFESLIYPIIFSNIDSHLTDSQHGFRCGRSVETNLSLFVSTISREVDRGLQVDTIYTDFTSAFDTVSHSVLLSKLDMIGISGSFLEWFSVTC